jgi:hydroxymethylpyrimidine/phosphomethylpyrimidine kinase
MLAGPNGINDMSQAVFYNALSFAITGTRSYSQKAVSFIDTFFLTKATAMTPNINYGQIIRGIGPEHQVGTFTGVLDTRGMVKVVNAIIALKNAKSPDWDDKKDAAMMAWMTQYVQWLETSSIAKKTSSSAKCVFSSF